MKSLLTLISALAIANLLALGGVVAWLRISDRLNMERVQMVRQAFSRTIADEAQNKAEAATKAEQERASAAEAERIAKPPVTAAETIDTQRREEDEELQVLQRKQREIESLRSALSTQLASLERRERDLEAAKAAFERSRTETARMSEDRQFREALSTLEGQKPRDAKQVLRALIDAGSREQAVAYLSKMDESKRAKVVAEFVKDDPSLAAGLLESVRTRGMPADEAIRDANADRAPNPATGAAGTSSPRR